LPVELLPDRCDIIGQDVSGDMVEPVNAARHVPLAVDVEEVLPRITGVHAVLLKERFGEPGEISA